MAKEQKSEKKDKKDKKHSRSEVDGISKKSKKDKKKESKVNGDHVIAAVDSMEVDTVATEVKPIGALVPFANPLADEKGTKKVLKSVKKAAKNKSLKRGVKEVVKSLRKSPLSAPNAGAGVAGIVVLAADISPMDVISHIPVLCEDHNVPYVYVRSRAELGAAGNTKRPTSVVMVQEKRAAAKAGVVADAAEDEEWKETWGELVKFVEKEGRNVRI